MRARPIQMNGVIIVSGGMDSMTLLHMLHQADHELHALSFDYGQRHVKELEFARDNCEAIGVDWTLVDLTRLQDLLIDSSSSLVNPHIPVPEGHYREETMKATVVPNRNSIMLNIATGVAIAEGADYVGTAIHSGDHAVYPDCRPEFVRSLVETLKIANEGFINPDFTILAPFMYIPKSQIAATGATLDPPVDWTKTWSCYNGEEIHCGRCSTCVERQEAFHDAGIEDPTEYVDSEFWKTAVAEFARDPESGRYVSGR